MQVAHGKMLTARKGLDGHAVYGRVRNGSELLELLGVDGMDAGRDARIQTIHGEGTTAAQLLRGGIPTAQLLRCGYSIQELHAGTLDGSTLDGFITSLPEVQALAAKVMFAPVETLTTCAEIDFGDKRLDVSDIKLFAQLLPYLRAVSLK